MPANPSNLGRRERQIMDIVFRLGRATAQEVLAELADPPSNSAIRGMLRLLEEKGYLTHEQDGPRYVYRPTVAPEQASRSAMRHLISTFFGGSRESAVAALLDDAPISAEEYERLTGLLRAAQQTGDDR
jgi:predicted transcriptional regulator